MYQLNAMVTDIGTGLLGMLTHLNIEMNQTRVYRFQPRGLNPETGAPVSALWIVPERIKGGITVPEPELPLQVLGTDVEDIATGFKGTATALVLHATGCLHIAIQPKGKLKSTGAPADGHDFDIRRVKGSALKPMTAKQVKKSQDKDPSPIEAPTYKPARTSC